MTQAKSALKILIAIECDLCYGISKKEKENDSAKSFFLVPIQAYYPCYAQKKDIYFSWQKIKSSGIWGKYQN